MANKTVHVKVTRPYPRGGETHGVGRVLQVPEGVAKSMEQAKPPYGERISATDAKEAKQDADTVVVPAEQPQESEKKSGKRS